MEKIFVYPKLFDNEFLIVYQNNDNTFNHFQLHVDKEEKVLHICQPNLSSGTSIINALSDYFVEKVCEQLDIENWIEYTAIIYYTSEYNISMTSFKKDESGSFEFNGTLKDIKPHLDFIIECYSEILRYFVKSKKIYTNPSLEDALSNELNRIIELQKIETIEKVVFNIQPQFKTKE